MLIIFTEREMPWKLNIENIMSKPTILIVSLLTAWPGFEASSFLNGDYEYHQLIVCLEVISKLIKADAKTSKAKLNSL